MISKIKALFLETDGGKKTVKKGNLTLLGLVLFTLGVFFLLLPQVIDTINGTDTSQVKRSNKPITEDSTISDKKDESKGSANNNVGGVTNQSNDPSDENQNKLTQQQLKKSLKVIYKASQVIQRNGNAENNLPLGTNVIGKLLSSIDTRNLSTKKVILPYGVKSKTGDVLLPVGTIIIGQPGYPGQGEKVFINFTKGVLPHGKQFDLQGQALSTNDNSPGLTGVFHSNTVNRVASVLGLSMVSGVTEVLVEKESLGQGFNVTPRPYVKNGLLNGVSKVANTEANIQASKLAAKPEYVTIDTGQDLIVSFLNLSLNK